MNGRKKVSRTVHNGDHVSIFRSAEHDYIEHRIAKLKSDLSKRNIDIAAPCTNSLSSDCWLLDNLTPFNRILYKAGLEICEIQPQFLTVRPTGFRVRFYNEEDASLDAAFIIDWLVTHHACINALELHHAFCCKHPADVMMVLASALNLQKLKLSWQSIDGAHYITGGLRHSHYMVLELDLSGLCMDDRAADDLSTALKRNPHLRSFAIFCSRLTPHGYEKLLGTLSKCENLTVLRVHNTGRCGGKPLADFLRHNKTIRKFSMNDCDTVNDCALMLGSLNANTSVQELDVFRCRVGDRGAQVLAAVLKRPDIALHSIRLEQCGICAPGAICLARSLENNTSLEYLNLSANEFDTYGTAALSEMLKVNVTLKRLDISQCSVTPYGVFLVVNALLVNTVVEEVIVGRVQVRSRERPHLPCHILTRLQMHWRSHGLYELADAIMSGRQIETVHTDDPCPLSAGAYTALFSALRRNGSIKTLSLTVSFLGNMSMEALTTLGAVLSESVTLKEVQIRQDSVTTPMAVVYAGLAHSKSITHFEVKDEFWRSKSVKALCRAIKNNTSLLSLVIHSHHLIRKPKLLELLSNAVYANRTLTSVQVEDLEGSTKSAFKIREACRRNSSVLHRASRFVLRTTVDRPSAAAFEEVSRDVLVHNLTEMSNIDKDEVDKMIHAAELFLRVNYFQLAGVVKRKLECISEAEETRKACLGILNEDCLCNIASFLRISDVLSAGGLRR